jgi:carnitine O-acetyltransferase
VRVQYRQVFGFLYVFFCHYAYIADQSRIQNPLMTVQPRRSTHSISNSPRINTASSTSTILEGYEADPTQQGPDPAMLLYQDSLPHLPVPPLASTLSKYPEMLRPHLSPAEYPRSESIVRVFGASKQAEELQRRLETRASSSDEVVVNWLADWWNETAYMAFREPVVVNVSYFYVHAHHVPDGDGDEAICDALVPKRAVRLLKAMLPFRTLVETCVQLSWGGGD